MTGMEGGESEREIQPEARTCTVVGGGLAGLSCAAALAGAGFRVTLLEARPFPGGRATSYQLPDTPDAGSQIDNCQHILLRCCTNLLDFYARLGVDSSIRFHKEIYFLEPGGRVSTVRAGRLPAPLHLAGSFAALRCLSWPEKLAIGRALLALRREWPARPDLDRITMLDWLREKRQPHRAVERFWRQVLVSAVNEELDRMAARHGLQVMWFAFLARADSYELGIPEVPLGRLYDCEVWKAFSTVALRFRNPVERIGIDHGRARAALTSNGRVEADYFVSCVPFERLSQLVPELGLDFSTWDHSPITGIHLWFDRKVTDLPHGTLLDRTIQWFFNKADGCYLQLVVSASRDLVRMPRAEVIGLALRELSEFLPAVAGAKLVKAHVVKEVRATFSATPGLESVRPGAETPIENLFLAGDWTCTGWPATMEGAVRSGYLAAEAVTAAAGTRRSFLQPDIA